MSNECIQAKKSITKKKLIKLVAEEVNRVLPKPKTQAHNCKNPREG